MVIAAAFAFASGVQATNWLISQTNFYYQENVAWKKHEEKILNQLSPNMQLQYAEQILGEPIFRDGGEKYKEYVFKRRAHWVQLVTDDNNKIQLYSIAICDPSFQPKIKLPGEKTVQMNKDTLATSGNKQTHYFISGATSNSYLIEGGYGANPENYQSTYLGTTDSCGGIHGEEYYVLLDRKKCPNSHLGVQGYSEDFCQYDTEDSEISAMRKNIKIDTVAITAPNVGISDLRPRFQIGPDRIELRVLPEYYKEYGR